MNKQKKWFRKAGAIRLVLACVLAVAAIAAVDQYKAVAAGRAAVGGEKVSLVPHKALYGFRLVAVLQSGAGLTGVRGQMYYEQDDTCDAWTTDHRFAAEYQYAERTAIINNSHYVGWEAQDGSAFYFSSERQENGAASEQLRGSVLRRDDGSAKAEYARPDDLSFDLPAGYLLPTAHTTEVIRRARAGEKFFNAVVFDGTDAEGPIEINVVIGAALTPAELAAEARKHESKNIDAALLRAPAWHVRMAIFPLRDREEMSPSYEMQMVLHDNGIISFVHVNYKTFQIEQSLEALEALPVKNCG